MRASLGWVVVLAACHGRAPTGPAPSPPPHHHRALDVDGDGFDDAAFDHAHVFYGGRAGLSLAHAVAPTPPAGRAPLFDDLAIVGDVSGESVHSG